MLAPDFARFGAVPPAALEDGYRPFALDPGMLAMLLVERPGVVSFHFGLPPADQIAALRDSGAVLLTMAQLSMLLEGIDWRGVRATWQPSVAA